MSNAITITGNLTKDPTTKKTKNGDDMIQFGLADNGYGRDAIFYSVTFFGSMLVNLIGHAKKGSLVQITGSLDFYEKDGVTYKNVTGGLFTFVNTGRRREGGQDQSVDEVDDDEDLPF